MMSDRGALLRPLEIGLSIGHPRGSSGSIGPFVTLADRRSAFLSSSAALAPKGATPGDWIHQPGPSHRSILTGQTRVGQLVDFTVPLTGRTQSIDFAAVVLTDGTEGRGNIVPDGAPQAGQTICSPEDPSTFEPGDEVAFIGAASGYRQARISAVEVHNVSVAIGPKETTLYDRLIELASTSSGPCSRPGDGGALIWRIKDMTAVGMILASATGSEGFYTTYVCALQPALAFLGASLSR